MLGFHIRLTGEAPRAAKFAGVNPARLILFCLGLSGALAGLAGMFEVSGPSGVVSIDFNVGYGFTAIIVAFLGRLHPVGILLAGGLMALTYIGGENRAIPTGPARCCHSGLPGNASVFPAGFRSFDKLPHPCGP